MNAANANTTSSPVSRKPNSQAWYRPIFSPEHGVYVMLAVSFLTGAAAAQSWTWATTWAFICAFCGFQAEHPWMLQLKQRKSFKPRFWVWGSLYSAIALAIALYLYSQTPIILWICLGAIAALGIDAVSVWQREQKSVWNELMTFTGVCLSAPFAYAATTGTIAPSILGIWVLNSLFFSSAIFTVKLRKPKTSALTPSLIYHAIASLIVLGLGLAQWLSPVTVAAFSCALLKFGIILWQQDWYRTTQIQQVAILETTTALCFLAIVSLSVLPAHLPM